MLLTSVCKGWSRGSAGQSCAAGWGWGACAPRGPPGSPPPTAVCSPARSSANPCLSFSYFCCSSSPEDIFPIAFSEGTSGKEGGREKEKEKEKHRCDRHIDQLAPICTPTGWRVNPQPRYVPLTGIKLEDLGDQDCVPVPGRWLSGRCAPAGGSVVRVPWPAATVGSQAALGLCTRSRLPPLPSGRAPRPCFRGSALWHLLCCLLCSFLFTRHFPGACFAPTSTPCPARIPGSPWLLHTGRYPSIHPFAVRGIHRLPT